MNGQWTDTPHLANRFLIHGHRESAVTLLARRFRRWRQSRRFLLRLPGFATPARRRVR